MNVPLRPTLVCMAWRGGARFRRCLGSIATSRQHFQRIVLSVTSDHGSEDMKAAREFQRDNPDVEVICTGRELPTMQHQAFWVDYLQRTGTIPTDWIYWLAYDDQVLCSGVEAITDGHGNWPLQPSTAYFGPWAMRHEQAGQLWHGNTSMPLESWTSFPEEGPTKLAVIRWIADQLRQPTYMQMSGSVNPFASFLELKEGRPVKQGPMRIEMAIAACRTITHVQEFPHPVSIIYGRPDSDRASYGKQARREDVHLLAWLAKYCAHHPRSFSTLAEILTRQAGRQLRGRGTLATRLEEEWRLRGRVDP